MWRRDAGRTAESPEALPEDLHEQWTHDLPTPAPAYRAERLRFDEGPEPVVADGRVFVSSSRNDSVIALGLADGNELWRIHVGGPVRFAPVASDGKLWFGSDDGYLRCVDAANGKELWRGRVRGNYRSSPILAGDHLYFFSEQGRGTVLRAGRTFHEVAVSEVPDMGTTACPAVSRGSIFVRGKTHLYKIRE